MQWLCAGRRAAWGWSLACGEGGYVMGGLAPKPKTKLSPWAGEGNGKEREGGRRDWGWKMEEVGKGR